MFFSLFDSGPFKVTPARPEVFQICIPNLSPENPFKQLLYNFEVSSPFHTTLFPGGSLGFPLRYNAHLSHYDLFTPGLPQQIGIPKEIATPAPE